MTDRRQDIIDASIAILREEGYAGFTQPRVASRLGIRQSNLTYYFPTRLDLLKAVGRIAVDRQLTALNFLTGLTTADAAADAIARRIVMPDNTRVLMALVQGADKEPELRALFRELTDGVASHATALLKGLGNAEPGDGVFLLHALAVGLGVINLAIARPDGEDRAKAAIELYLTLFAAR